MMPDHLSLEDLEYLDDLDREEEISQAQAAAALGTIGRLRQRRLARYGLKDGDRIEDGRIVRWNETTPFLTRHAGTDRAQPWADPLDTVG